MKKGECSWSPTYLLTPCITGTNQKKKQLKTDGQDSVNAKNYCHTL